MQLSPIHRQILKCVDSSPAPVSAKDIATLLDRPSVKRSGVFADVRLSIALLDLFLSNQLSRIDMPKKPSLYAPKKIRTVYAGKPILKDKIYEEFKDHDYFRVDDVYKRLGCTRGAVNQSLRTLMAHKLVAKLGGEVINCRMYHVYTIKHRDAPQMARPDLCGVSTSKQDYLAKFWFKEKEHAA